MIQGGDFGASGTLAWNVLNVKVDIVGSDGTYVLDQRCNGDDIKWAHVCGCRNVWACAKRTQVE